MKDFSEYISSTVAESELNMLCFGLWVAFYILYARQRRQNKSAHHVPVFRVKWHWHHEAPQSLVWEVLFAETSEVKKKVKKVSDTVHCSVSATILEHSIILECCSVFVMIMISFDVELKTVKWVDHSRSIAWEWSTPHWLQQGLH